MKEAVRVDINRKCKCGGTKKDTCPECRGKGEMKSSWNGPGDGYSGYDGVCRTCGGEKKVPCLKCNGSGWYEDTVSGEELLVMLGIKK